MLQFVKNLRDGALHKMNRRRVASCGENSRLVGIVEMRKPGAIVAIGSDSRIEGHLVAESADSRMVVGDNVFIGRHTVIDCFRSVTIEDDVLISFDCLITDADNHSLRAEERREDLRFWREKREINWSAARVEPVLVAKGVWIGAKVIVLRGVTVGEGSVVGAGSVVTASVPPWTIVAGNPARVIQDLKEHNG